jgi:glucose-6-phosphate 1-epimerase
MMNQLEHLNQQFSIDNHLAFVSGKGGLVMLSVTTPTAAATISLHGGQVLSYRPVTNDINCDHDLLFVSHKAFYQNDKAIKGGAPICWPWFGAHAQQKSLPFHGFVRSQSWQVEATEYRDNGDVVITLVFRDTEKTRELWPFAFELRQIITIGATLGIKLITHNTGTAAFDLSQAIHTYFSVGDIGQVSVTGLEGKPYLDKVDQFAEKIQSGPVTVGQEVDRIYQQAGTPLEIHDKEYHRNIRITCTGSATAVVWNPWKEISRQSQDLEDDSYRYFICVETANAADNIVTVAAGDAYSLGVKYEIEYR